VDDLHYPNDQRFSGDLCCPNDLYDPNGQRFPNDLRDQHESCVRRDYRHPIVS
jgi:hypothetical protein